MYWTLPFQQDPTLDYMHKYVVTEVRARDNTTNSPAQLTSYAYLGAPAWHFDDNEALAAWINDMEGYFSNRGLPAPEAQSWQLIAHMLLAARIYE